MFVTFTKTFYDKETTKNSLQYRSSKKPAQKAYEISYDVCFCLILENIHATEIS